MTTKAQQDDADSPLTRHIRTAMKAIDKIAATEIDELERVRALNRIEAYTLVAGRRVCGIAQKEEEWEKLPDERRAELRKARHEEIFRKARQEWEIFQEHMG